MKALSMDGPWAMSVALRDKTIECRSWQTNHLRGTLAMSDTLNLSM